MPRSALHSRLRRIIAGLFSSLVLFVSLPAAAYEHVLESGAWEILVLPGDASALTIEQLFGDELAIEDLAESSSDTSATWAAYRFDRGANRYAILGGGDKIAVGEAFWLIQSTMAPVVLDIPLDLPPVSTTSGISGMSGTPGETCASAACFVVDMPAVMDDPIDPDALVAAFGMAGLPAAQTLAAKDIMFSVVDDADASSLDPDCVDGCPLATSGADSLKYTPKGVFVYNPATEDYVDLPFEDVEFVLAPWQGFFWAVSNRVGVDSQLNLPVALETFVAGTVVSTGGVPLDDAAIYLDDNEQPLDFSSDGEFLIGLPPGSEVVLRIEAEGYATAVVPVLTGLIDMESTLDVTLAPHALDTTFFSGEATVLRTEEGASVSLPSDAFVDASGQGYLGDVTATITPLDVANPAELRAFPGEFAGIASGGAEESIVSLGTVNYEFRDESGRELELAAPAIIEIPLFIDSLPEGSPVVAGQRIALWSLDETIGLWVQEGGGPSDVQDAEGVVVASASSPTGLALRATVTHFSWWNCDVATQTGSVEVQVAGSGSGVATITGTTAADVGWRPASVTESVLIGGVTRRLPVPAGFEACFFATLGYLSGAEAVTAERCVTPAVGETLRVVLAAPDTSDTLAIGSDPDADNGVVSLKGRENRPIEAIGLGPLSIESTLAWTVTGGALPPGVSLRASFDGTRAQVAGVPSADGTFAATVTARNDSGNEASLEITYVIESAPIRVGVPQLPEIIQLPVRRVSNEVDLPDEISQSEFELVATGVLLDTYNTGGSVITWSLDEGPNGLIEGFMLDPDTGVLSVVDGSQGDSVLVTVFFEGQFLDQNFEVGLVSATNASGTSTALIRLGEARTRPCDDATCPPIPDPQ